MIDGPNFGGPLVKARLRANVFASVGVRVVLGDEVLLSRLLVQQLAAKDLRLSYPGSGRPLV
jgi:hypothetical protein